LSLIVRIKSSIYLSNDILLSALLKSIEDDDWLNIKFIIDSGFYSGQDICKGLMLGADFVMTGRPFIIGLAALGDRGANHVHDILKDELANVMEQVCAKNIEELKSEDVVLEDDFTLNKFKLSS